MNQTESQKQIEVRCDNPKCFSRRQKIVLIINDNNGGGEKECWRHGCSGKLKKINN